jgi:hypothetical protein
MSVQIRTILGSKIQTCMCHNPDNFEPLAEICTGVRTVLAGEPSNIIEYGIHKKIILLQFLGLLHMSAQNLDNFGYLAEVCVTVWTISCSGIFLHPDNSQLG